MDYKNGKQLHPDDQKFVLAAYPHRYTGEHMPQWARDSKYPVQFKDDQDWLAHTDFRVKKDGRLDQRAHFCESHPTWPNGNALVEVLS